MARGKERPKSAVQRNVTSTAVYGHGYQSNVDEKTSQYDREAHGSVSSTTYLLYYTLTLTLTNPNPYTTDALDREEWPTETRHHRNSASPRHRRRSPRNNNRNNNRKKPHHDREIADMR